MANALPSGGQLGGQLSADNDDSGEGRRQDAQLPSGNRS